MLNSWVAPYRPFDVEEFLRRVKSPRLRDMPDFGRWIGAAAQQNDIRAEWLLKVAQQEQSFVTRAAGGRGWQRALDFTMGYGALDDGTDLPQYRGVRTQVFASAAGIRGYLTPGAKYDVTDWPGTRRTYGGETRVIRNLAEAVCLRYTPHWSTLTTCERIWQMFDFEDGGEDMPTTDDVARIAKQVCAKFATGYRGNMTINGISFELSDVAYCSEFVRECACAAAGEPAFGTFQRRYFGADARESERLMKRNAEAVTEAHAEPGDVVCFNAGNAGKWGHIGIYLGADRFAENTSSTSRGPGFVTSSFAQIGRGRISGFYHLPEFVRGEERALKIVRGLGTPPDGVIADANLALENGVLRGDVRPILEALGYTVEAKHLATQGKVYIWEG